MGDRHAANADGRVCLSPEHAAALRAHLTRSREIDVETDAAIATGDSEALERLNLEAHDTAISVVGYLDGCFKAAEQPADTTPTQEG